MVSCIKAIAFGFAASLIVACTFVSEQNHSTDKDETLAGIAGLIENMSLSNDTNQNNESLLKSMIEDYTGDSLLDEIIVVATRR